MKPTDKAFQKAAMGLPLSEEDQRLIQEEKVRREVEAQAKKRHEGAKQNLAMEVVDGASEELRRKILQSLLPKGMGDKFAGGVAERLDEELNSLIQDYETIKEFADFLANSTPEQRQALLNKYGDAAKKLFTDSEYRGQVGDAIVEAFKEGITDDIEKFTRITSGDEKDIGYTTTHAALMAYGIWKRYGKKIGKEVVRAVDDDVAKNTVDSKTLKKAKDVGVKQEDTTWKFGEFKSETKWSNQMAKRGWTPKQINEALKSKEFYKATNNVNPNNSATRFVHPTTGRSVVIDDITKEILQVGGDGFKW
jgi:hypothetical protein